MLAVPVDKNYDAFKEEHKKKQEIKFVLVKTIPTVSTVSFMTSLFNLMMINNNSNCLAWLSFQPG